ncbi:hypothetical protein BC938DRAFT_473435 [Jimgerdemannia flammicorona]|uniref:Uncharacterized protein n=1 Tax=Jimgerdemannia flammicorona TaxID=994334 RepID=A0A433Q402_9FUNG|nr:hypothetical protein BC938DRAFT_473435 [Jimgerdemannia flammicorona]
MYIVALLQNYLHCDPSSPSPLPGPFAARRDHFSSPTAPIVITQAENYVRIGVQECDLGWRVRFDSKISATSSSAATTAWAPFPTRATSSYGPRPLFSLHQTPTNTATTAAQQLSIQPTATVPTVYTCDNTGNGAPAVHVDVTEYRRNLRFTKPQSSHSTFSCPISIIRPALSQSIVRPIQSQSIVRPIQSQSPVPSCLNQSFVPSNLSQSSVPSNLNQSSVSTVRLNRPSQSSISIVRLVRPNRPSQSSVSIVRRNRPSQSSVSIVRLNRPSQSSVSIVRLNHPSQSSVSFVRLVK